jgi:hypothetical protein
MASLMKNTGVLIPTMSLARGQCLFLLLYVGMLLTKIPLIGVKPRGQPVHVSGGIYAAPLANHRGHSGEHRRLFARLREKRSSCDIAKIAITCEDSISTCNVLDTTGSNSEDMFMLPAPLAWTGRSGI